MLRSWFVVLCFAACVVMASCASNPVAEGDEAFEARDYFKALSVYEKALNDGEVTRADVGDKIDTCRSEIAKAQINEARVCAEKGEYPKALQLLEKARQGDAQAPDIDEAAREIRGLAFSDFDRKAKAALEAGKLDDAVAFWQKAKPYSDDPASIDRKAALALCESSEAALKDGAFQKASDAAKQALGLEAGNPRAKSVLETLAEKKTQLDAKMAQAKAARDEGKYEEAAKLFKEALSLWPGHPEASKQAASTEKERLFWTHFRLGDTYMARKEWDKAIAAFEQAKSVDPLPTVEEKLNLARYNKWIEEGERFEADKKYEEAVASFEKALGVATETAKAALGERINNLQYGIHLNKGMAFEVERKWVKALEAYKKASEFAKDRTEINRRVITVQDHIVTIKCDKCNGSGKVDDYRVKEVDGKRDLVKVGMKPCPHCGGTGQIVKEKD